MANNPQNISLEPLLNQSSTGSGTAKRIATVPVNLVGGSVSHRTALAINATPQQVTIGTGKRSIEIWNAGNNIVYYGGSGVSDATGVAIYPKASKLFNNVKDDFNFYIVCGAGLTSTLNVVEYE